MYKCGSLYLNQINNLVGIKESIAGKVSTLDGIKMIDLETLNGQRLMLG